ncbi:MAG: 1-phosphofructokinase [Clostridiales bacterium]|uniref:1-phosphofructokinase n=1 Tax=Roseburia sp. MSJ-14 TaxID=2841514 RepID=UPI0016A1B5B4|nr:1-phosphofructokinase [Roseburia sp. MSJ-14]MBU5474601.1 1-phosphofructokinase [Roseburia sp. MSJ-14]NLK76573.1 1-phosphofructokinase [Clostridiales bacterium]
MIYTVTFNPCLDYIVSVDDFTLGRVNRTTKELVYPGGKGINVSLVLKNLGMESTALGFTAGFTGTEIEQALQRWGCYTDFIRVEDGMSRINIKLRSNEESEINGQGPKISKEALEQLYEKLDAMTSEDVLVLAGSIPGSMPDSSYELIMERVAAKNMKVAVDATGDLLVNVLKYHPFLIKPNNHELEEIFHTPMDSNDTIIVHAKKLQQMGAKNVLISMAGDGAILVSEDGEVRQSPAPKGKVVNSVGAGDSMVAGFLTGYLTTGNYGEAFRMGIATGSASAFSERLATKPEVEEILKKL